MVRTEIEVRKLIEQYITHLSKIMTINRVILYGSHANGTATEDSDIDIAVESPDFSDNYLEEWQRLYQNVWRSGVEPVVEPRPLYPKNKTFFDEEIIKKGKVIYQAKN